NAGTVLVAACDANGNGSCNGGFTHRCTWGRLSDEPYSAARTASAWPSNVGLAMPAPRSASRRDRSTGRGKANGRRRKRTNRRWLVHGLSAGAGGLGLLGRLRLAERVEL